jgi:hypothetical protein
VLVPAGKPTNVIADFLPRHAFAFELGTHVLQRPQTGLRPIDLVALGIEPATAVRQCSRPAVSADQSAVPSGPLRRHFGQTGLEHDLPAITLCCHLRERC